MHAQPREKQDVRGRQCLPEHSREEERLEVGGWRATERHAALELNSRKAKSTVLQYHKYISNFFKRKFTRTLLGFPKLTPTL